MLSNYNQTERELHAEFDEQGKELRDKIKDLSIEEAIESDYLTTDQKQMLSDALERAMQRAREDWEYLRSLPLKQREEIVRQSRERLANAFANAFGIKNPIRKIRLEPLSDWNK